jgi:hypothetical protein
MYPAEAFNSGAITIDDLPDSIVFYGNKNNPPISSPLPDGTPFLVYYGFSNEGVGIQNENSAWTIRQDFGIGEADECLFRDVAAPLFRDNFEDTYTLHAAEIVLLERESLCVWSGIGESGCSYSLFYGDRGSDYWGSGELYKWSVQYIAIPFCGEGELMIKEVSQNSPVGSYGGAEFEGEIM